MPAVIRVSQTEKNATWISVPNIPMMIAARASPRPDSPLDVICLRPIAPSTMPTTGIMKEAMNPTSASVFVRGTAFVVIRHSGMTAKARRATLRGALVAEA